MTTPVPPPAPMIATAKSQVTSAPLTLWNAVVTARVALARERRMPQGSSVPLARADLLSALEAYVKCLGERGRPIPYVMRDELRIQRLTCPTDRQRHAAPTDEGPR